MPRRLAEFLLLSGSLPLVAADWPRFRGPNGAGVADAATVPDTWSGSANVVWKVPAPGGNSSPIVSNGRVYLQSASKDGAKRLLVCLDAATGKTKWEKEVGGKTVKTHPKNSLASGTPATDGERVYTLFWDGSAVALHAHDLGGNELWQQSLGSFKSQHGAGHSPVAHAGKVFVNFDQDGAAAVVAFDAKTGAKAWEQTRKPFRACYSTPLVRDLPGGKTELVVASTAGAAGYDPDSGAVNWSWDWKFPDKPLRTVASPVLAGGLLVLTSGDGDGSRHATAVTIGPGAEPVWEKKRKADTPYVPCPVVSGDHLYWVADTGHVACLDVRTGQEKWREQVIDGSVSASPVLVGDRLIVIGETGKCVVLQVSPAGGRRVAVNDLGERVFASPAVADGNLYLRGGQHLFCIRGK